MFSDFCSDDEYIEEHYSSSDDSVNFHSGVNGGGESVEHPDGEMEDHSMHVPYYYIFCDTNGAFRSEFPDMYEEDDASSEPLPCLLTVLGADNDHLQPVQAEKAVPTIDASVSTELQKESNISQAVAADTPPQPNAAAVKPVAVATENGAADPYRATEHSRFLAKHLTEAILLPVAPTATRQELRAMHAPQFPGKKLFFGLGSIEDAPTGWALPLTVDSEILGSLSEQYPGSRKPTEEDIQSFKLFRRVEAGEKSGGATAEPKEKKEKKKKTPTAAAAPKPKKKATKQLAALMRDKERLLASVERAGGWGKAKFVVFDVEFAITAAGSLTIPLEFSFLHAPSPSQEPDTHKDLHFFVHPGSLPAEILEGACYTSLHIHGIPFYDATFLRKDYDVLARMVQERYMNDPSVILLCKGTSMTPTVGDVQALRLLFAAAREKAGADAFTIPPVDSICCFDSEVFANTLAEVAAVKCTHKKAQNTTDAADADAEMEEGLGCWYHERMQARLQAMHDDVATLHCALRDNERLRGVVKSDLACAEL